MSALDDLADELGVDRETAYAVFGELVFERKRESETLVREDGTTRVYGGPHDHE